MKKSLALLLGLMMLWFSCSARADSKLIQAESEEAFYGEWEMEEVYMDGIPVGFDTLEWLAGLVYDGGSNYKVSEARLVISKGKAKLVVGTGENAKTKKSAKTFSNGVLILNDPMGILGEDVRLALCEDGRLTSEASIRYGILSFQIKVYMCRAEDV